MRLTSKYDGKCKACWHAYVIGDPIEWDPQTRKSYHPACAPQSTSSQQARSVRPAAAPTALIQRDNAQDAALEVLAALEKAIILRADQLLTADMAKGWDRLQKAKALALSPGTDGEGRAALRLALLEAVKAAF